MARPAWLNRVTAVRVRLTTALDLVGAGLISAGAALIYVPAGLIVAGALVLVASFNAAGKDST